MIYDKLIAIQCDSDGTDLSPDFSPVFQAFIKRLRHSSSLTEPDALLATTVAEESSLCGCDASCVRVASPNRSARPIHDDRHPVTIMTH
jgi:hypothetical protein